jgi:hypothetical protein
MADHYRSNEIRRVLTVGPYPDEDWYRLRINGQECTRHLNLDAEEVEYIAAYLDARDNPDA